MNSQASEIGHVKSSRGFSRSCFLRGCGAGNVLDHFASCCTHRCRCLRCFFLQDMHQEQTLLQLFQQEPSHVPAVPVSSGSQQATASPSGGYSQSAPDATSTENLNTLDEPVWHTIKRDLIRIYGNLILVVFPFKNRDQQSAALRNWDLWGPMVCMRPSCPAGSIWTADVMPAEAAYSCLQVFTLTLAICLSAGSQKPGSVFSVSSIPNPKS